MTNRGLSRRAVPELRARSQQIWQSDRSLSALLFFLAFTVFIADPLSEVGAVGHFIIGLVFTAVLLSGIATVARPPLLAWTFGIVAVVTLGAHWVRYVLSIHRGLEAPLVNSADCVGTFVACGMLAGIVFAQVFREGSITVHRIEGAIAAYLLMGLMWAALYALIQLNDQQAFAFTNAAPTSAGSPVLRARFIYFSFTTLTTVGYGDITPVSPLARSLAMTEAMTGQLFPAILIARLVSLELYHRQRGFEREQAELDRQAVAREIAKLLRDEK